MPPSYFSLLRVVKHSLFVKFLFSLFVNLCSLFHPTCDPTVLAFGEPEAPADGAAGRQRCATRACLAVRYANHWVWVEHGMQLREDLRPERKAGE